MFNTNAVKKSPVSRQDVAVIAAKTTTQHAPLEKLLSWWRTRQVTSFVDGKTVLDFGCGAFLWTLRALGTKPRGRYGIDSIFHAMQGATNIDGMFVAGNFKDLEDCLVENGHQVDCILSLACFEHLEPEQFVKLLGELHDLSAPQAVIVGTVPTPRAKPVLEFLSFRLGLIDPSQIRDHKVYYDKQSLLTVLADTGWSLARYSTFQFGWNSRFVFEKVQRSNARA